MNIQWIAFALLCSQKASHHRYDFLHALALKRAGVSWFEIWKDPQFFWIQELFSSVGSQFWLNLQKSVELNFKSGMSWSLPGDEDFPESFMTLTEVPFYITYQGVPLWKQSVAVSIVGGREPQTHSLEWIENEFAEFLLHRQCIVISGGARGIDQASHRTALRSGRATLAVLPAGLNQMYPSSFREGYEQILKSGGCLLSEFEPNQTIRKHHFQQRNRLIASLGIWTLMIDARVKSGSLVTALHAAEMGRPVLVVPSHPYDRVNRGGLDLIAEGATLVRDAQDLISIFDAERQVFKTKLSPNGNR